MFLLALAFAFSSFVQAQTEPSDDEKKAVLSYVNKYNDLQNVIQNATQQFNELTVSQKGVEDELSTAKKMYINNIDEAIKIFTAIPAPAACKEIRLKMLAEMNGTRIIADKIVTDVYQKQANKESQCTGCNAAKLRAFKLRNADEKKQSEQNAAEMEKMMAALSSKHSFSLSQDKAQKARTDIFNKGLEYVGELMLIIDYFTDAHNDIVDAVNNALEKPTNIDALAKAITKYQNNCKEGNKLLLAFPNNYNGDGSLWKAGQEFANYANNFGQKTLPAVLAALKQANRSAADIKTINAGIEEHSKSAPLNENITATYYTFIAKLLKDKQ